MVALRVIREVDVRPCNQARGAAAAQELEAKGYTLLHGARTEPWGQTVARLLTAEGAIVGISYAPWLHEATERDAHAAT